MNETILTLVRHGQTAANTGGIWHGSTDTELSDHGREQASRVAEGIRKRFQPDAIYASDLQRAHDTARAIAQAVDVEIQLNPGLREYDLGSWEGRSYRELWDQEDLWGNMRKDPHFAPHGGESPLQVTQRLVGTLEEIAARHPVEHVVCVAHGGALSMALGHILDGDYSQWKRMLDNCSVSQITLGSKPQLLCFNEAWD